MKSCHPAAKARAWRGLRETGPARRIFFESMTWEWHGKMTWEYHGNENNKTWEYHGISGNNTWEYHGISYLGWLVIETIYCSINQQCYQKYIKILYIFTNILKRYETLASLEILPKLAVSKCLVKQHISIYIYTHIHIHRLVMTCRQAMRQLQRRGHLTLYYSCKLDDLVVFGWA
jgi:hypothetical protein